jgi:hypothetical protein
LRTPVGVAGFSGVFKPRLREFVGRSGCRTMMWADPRFVQFAPVMQLVLIPTRKNKHLPALDPFARVVCLEWKRKAFIVGVIVVYGDHELLQSGFAD